MSVSCRQRETVFEGQSGNPDVVFRKWPALVLKALFKPAIFASNVGVAPDDGAASRELLHRICVLNRLARLRGSEKQFSNDDRGNEHLGCLVQIGQHTFIPLQQGDDDVGVQ